MKLILHCAILVALFSVGSCLSLSEEIQNEEFDDELTKIILCMSEHEVTKEDIVVADFALFENPAETSKCYLYCMMSGFGYMDDRGKFIPEAIQKVFIDNPERFEAEKECSIEYENPCETAFQNAACLRKYDVELK